MKVPLLFTGLLFLSSTNSYAAIQVSTVGNSSVSVKQEVQNQVTKCINGSCATTGGGAKATVCINGKCREVTDRNIDINEGGVQIHIKNSEGNSNSSVTVEVNSSGSNLTKDATKSAQREKIQANKQRVKTFFETLIELLRKLFPFS